jgi:hypothetical protein
MAVLLLDAAVDCMAVLLLGAVVDCMAVLLLDAVVDRMAVLLTLRPFEIGSGSSRRLQAWQGQPTEVWGELRDYSGESRGIFGREEIGDSADGGSATGVGFQCKRHWRTRP